MVESFDPCALWKALCGAVTRIMFAASLLVGVLMTAFALVHVHVPDAYMDEVFHVPQTVEYCQGRFDAWDDMITTPPGLYLLAVGVYKPVEWLMGYSVCSVMALRLVNLVGALVLFVVCMAINTRIHGHYTTWMAASVVLLPFLFMQHVLYYTDTWSTCLVLMAYLAALDQRYWMSAWIAWVSCWFRQTNVVWMLFVAAVSLDRAWKGTVLQQRAIDVSILDYVWACIHTIQTRWRDSLDMLIPYVLVLLSFVGFVVWNGGIVLGDRTNHVAVLHIPQLYYFTTTLMVLTWLTSPVEQLQQTRTTWRWLWSHKLVAIVMTICIGITVHLYTYEHRYLLADNRHLTFYVWRRIVKRHWIVPYALTPVYALSATHIVRSLARTKTLLFCVAYGAATALVLVPAALLEPRYFILPYVMYRLQTPQRSLVEPAVFTVVNGWMLWMFVFRWFLWPNSSQRQRLMW
jgi:alpha-1,2-glucosyltransferase